MIIAVAFGLLIAAVLVVSAISFVTMRRVLKLGTSSATYIGSIVFPLGLVGFFSYQWMISPEEEGIRGGLILIAVVTIPSTWLAGLLFLGIVAWWANART